MSVSRSSRSDFPVEQGDARTADREVEGFRPVRESPESYEAALTSNPEWALNEASQFFEERGSVFETLRKIAQRLDELQIPYAVVGGLALFRHGVRRFTEDVDILVAGQHLATIHQHLSGLGYLPLHARSKNLRDTETRVRIEFLRTGDFPGDGKPKPVAFPDPQDCSFRAEGVSYIRLETLIELKLASGMTGAGRLKDLADVVEIIRRLDLELEFASRLAPYVREKYEALWNESRRRFVLPWKGNRSGGPAALAPEEQTRQAQLEQMLLDGVTIEDMPSAGPEDFLLVTTDPEIARKYDFVEESDYWGEGDAS